MTGPQEYYTILHTEYRKAKYHLTFFNEIIINDFTLSLFTIMRLADLLKMVNEKLEAIRIEVDADAAKYNAKKKAADEAAAASLPPPTPSPPYSIGYKSVCEVLDWKNFDQQICFIADIGRVPPKELIDFWKTPAEKFQPLTRLPLQWEMFAIEFRKQMCRAIMHAPPAGSQSYVIVLIDSVDVLELEPASQCRVYALPKELEKIPAFSTLSRIVKFDGQTMVPLRDLTMETVFSFKVIEPTSAMKCIHIEILSQNPFKRLLKVQRELETPTPPTSSDFLYESEHPTGSLPIPTNYSETVYLKSQESFSEQYVKYQQEFKQQEQEAEELVIRWNDLFTNRSPVDELATLNPVSALSTAAACTFRVGIVPAMAASGHPRPTNSRPITSSRSSSGPDWRSPATDKLKLASTGKPSNYNSSYNQRAANFSSQSSKGAIRKHSHKLSPSDNSTKQSTSYHNIMSMISSGLVLPNAGDVITIRPTLVTALNEFFAIFSKNETLLEMLSQSLYDMLISNTYFSYTAFPKPNTIVLAKLGGVKDQIIRAVVMGEVHNKQIEVFALDFGYSTLVTLPNIFYYDEKISNAPFQATLFRISNVRLKQVPHDVASGMEYLKRQIKDKVVKAVVKSLDGKYVLVRLIDNEGIDIGEKLCKRNFVNRSLK